MTTNPVRSEPADIPKRLERLETALKHEGISDDIDLRQIFYNLWKGKWFILALTTLSAIVSVGIALWLPDEYKATAVLTPASASSTSSLSKLAGQFGGLAALAGVNIGGSLDNDKTTAAMELVKSWGFQEKFVRDNQLEAAVFAANGWDRRNKSLRFDSDLYEPKQNRWIREFNPEKGETAEPGSWELYEKLSKRITITQDKKTNLISLSVEFYSPYLAKEWVDKIVIAVNKYLQDKDRVEASKSIEYLENKMTQTGLTEMKSVFSRLIEEQTKNLMLADVSDEYVLKTLSPAKVPEKKSGPMRAVICVLGTLGGCMLSTLIWFMWLAIRVPDHK